MSTWNEHDDKLLEALFVQLDPSSTAYLQYKLTVRQIEAQERTAHALELLATMYAKAMGWHEGPRAPAVDATRGPGRMRR